MLRFLGCPSSRIHGSHIAAPRLMVPQNTVDDAHLSGRFTSEAGMCFGVFVQLNEESKWAERYPVGYIIQENGCWEWVGGRSSNGYGRWRQRFAHRVVFILSGRVIPEGLELDHLCRNTLCVNPDHLEPVAPRENKRRGVGWSGVNARKTHCPRGHLYDYAFPNGVGRGCVDCRRTASREYQRRLRAKQRATISRSPCE